MSPEDLKTLSGWLNQESPTRDPQGVNAMADLVCRELDSSQFSVERIAGPSGIGDMLILRGGPRNHKKCGMLIAHLDTVHPRGVAQGALPVRLDGDRLYGPGAYDMKAGALLGLRGIQDALAVGRIDRPLVFTFAPDEEIGSPFSRAITERLAKDAAYALVLEPARENGGCVTSRKGVGRLEIDIDGVPAHSGVRHMDGRSAILEAAHQIIAIESLTDYAAGVTTTVGTISGGTAANTVPRHCTLSVDFRAPTASSCDEILHRIANIKPITRDTVLRVSGGVKRPPYERTPANVRLLHQAQAIAKDIGFALPEAPLTGGGSDGNFTSALGIPTLDGLGAEGAGAHTLNEYTTISSFERRKAFLAALVSQVEI